ncbi:MAG: hypothetical protein KAT32_03515 [Candidatus Moranbacteria bacterium]|nr:hypothetical protein [Candidatus Moranbacteria bacterium]
MLVVINGDRKLSTVRNGQGFFGFQIDSDEDFCIKQINGKVGYRHCGDESQLPVYSMEINTVAKITFGKKSYFLHYKGKGGGFDFMTEKKWLQRVFKTKGRRHLPKRNSPRGK